MVKSGQRIGRKSFLAGSAEASLLVRRFSGRAEPLLPDFVIRPLPLLVNKLLSPVGHVQYKRSWTLWTIGVKNNKGNVMQTFQPKFDQVWQL